LDLFLVTSTIGINCGLIEEGDRFAAFEVAHMGIFFVAGIYIIQAIAMVRTCGKLAKAWNHYDRETRSEVLAEVKKSSRVVPGADLLRYRMIRSYFTAQIKDKMPDDLPGTSNRLYY
jgi:hypothetical protein